MRKLAETHLDVVMIMYGVLMLVIASILKMRIIGDASIERTWKLEESFTARIKTFDDWRCA